MVDGFEVREQSYYDKLRKLIAVPAPRSVFFQTIVDAPFCDPLSATYVELGIIMFFVLDHKKQQVRARAISNTEQAKNAQKMSEIAFSEVRIPLSETNNQIVKTLTKRQNMRTDDWKDIFVPPFSVESSRLSQSEAGISGSIISPVNAGKTEGVLVFSFFKQSETPDLTERFVGIYSEIVNSGLKRL